jgi:hypothetical protein
MKSKPKEVERPTTFGVVVEYKGDMGLLRKSCEAFKASTFDKSKFNVVISSMSNNDVNGLVHETNLLLADGITTTLVMHTHQAYEFERDFNSFDKVSGMRYLVQIQPESGFEPDTLSQIAALTVDKETDQIIRQYVMFEGVGWTCALTKIVQIQYNDHRSYKSMIAAVRKSSREARLYKYIQRKSMDNG